MRSRVFHKLYFHYVWATKGRLHFIEAEVRDRVIPIIEEECRKRGGAPIACNTMPDHVHLLVNLPPKLEPTAFIGEIKGSSSYRHNHEVAGVHWLQWQEGYGVVTIREAEAGKVIRYIANQQRLHETDKISLFLETIEEQD